MSVTVLSFSCLASGVWLLFVMNRIFAISAPGLEAVLLDELRNLGVSRPEAVRGGVEFSGGIDAIRRVNLWSRIASRIVARVDEFHASSFHELERRAKRIEWKRFISAGDPVRFRVTCRKSKLYHSDAVAERLARAAGAPVRADDENSEDDAEGQLFIVRLSQDVLTISADTSGALLHRRGYRQAVAKAPLRETLAAGMIAGAEWDASMPLVDPMCGAGTIPIEAAMLARKIAPGLRRSFAFERWPEHDSAKWKSMTDKARAGELPSAPASIIGSDRDAGAIEAAKANAERAGVSADIEFSEAAISAARYPQPPGWIITNPPYGARVGSPGPLRNLYSQMGRIVREAAPGYRVALLSADRALEAATGLEFDEVFRTSNGGIPVRLVIA